MKYRKETRRRERDHYGVAVKENYRYAMKEQKKR